MAAGLVFGGVRLGEARRRWVPMCAPPPTKSFG
jgi:hypothetical protein